MENSLRTGFNTLLFMLLVSVVSACSSTPLPPSPEVVAGVYVRSGYEFYRWEEGIALMIWHDGIQSSDCASSTDEHSFVMRCHAISEQEVRFDWQLESIDGKDVDFRINDEAFDLVDGALFIISTTGGDTRVRQLDRDLSTVAPNADGVVEFGLADAAVLEHIQVSPIFEDCTSSSVSIDQMPDPAAAQRALVTFFSSLQAGEYERAVEYYGGAYDVMQDHNPDVAPDDRAALFRNACTVNGALCLKIFGATLIEQPSPAEYQYAVQFADEDGSIFTLGPCCGDSDPGNSPQEEFVYTVRLECTGKYRVLEMPVYMP